MLEIRWSSLSLRQSLALCMALTLLPLLLAAGLGYFILHRTVVGDYQDVARRQHDLLLPVRNLQLLMLQVEMPLEEYLASGSQERIGDYRAMRREVESTYPRLLPLLDAPLASLVARSREDWSALDRVVGDLLAAKQAGNTAAIQAAQGRFDTLQAAAHDKLDAAGDLLERKVEADYRDAALGLERSEWIAAIAGGISLVLMAAGLGLFHRTIVNSIDRLIEGADRFSQGDREHRIEIQIPRELHLVAEELNKMIGTIRASEDRLVEMAHRDSLTGLLNRTTWDENIATALQRQRRLHEGFAVVAADLDHFKKVNDSRGHDAGDAVLRIVAGILAESVRLIDKVFRMGGEEFVILLPACDAAAAAVTAERIRRTVEQRQIHAGGGPFQVTISLGIAVAAPGVDATTLRKYADIALYKAKAGGRNRVVVYEDGMA
ncbi:MAG TPA: diguanylate cyclase [Steroidobacteraceae bacterium]|nr:diguanylate cyclase [Steroidobacteraceae bacterium]